MLGAKMVVALGPENFSKSFELAAPLFPVIDALDAAYGGQVSTGALMLLVRHKLAQGMSARDIISIVQAIAECDEELGQDNSRTSTGAA